MCIRDRLGIDDDGDAFVAGVRAAAAQVGVAQAALAAVDAADLRAAVDRLLIGDDFSGDRIAHRPVERLDLDLFAGAGIEQRFLVPDDMALAVTQEFGTDVLILDRRCAADGEDSDQQASPWQAPRLYARHSLSPFPVSVARGCISRKAIANAYK